jgi:glycosyltransferase involved in cell wall biosynthesis
LGAEGLEVAPERELLVGDDPQALAAACVRLLRDEPLRRRLVERAEALYLSRFQWSRIRAEASRLALEVAGGHR